MRAVRRGATSAEYGLIASLIAVVILVGLTATGKGLVRHFTYLMMAVGDGPPPQWIIDQWPNVHGGDNLVSKPEMQSFVNSVCIGNCPDSQEIDNWYAEHDTNADNQFNYTEYVNMANDDGGDP